MTKKPKDEWTKKWNDYCVGQVSTPHLTYASSHLKNRMAISLIQTGKFPQLHMFRHLPESHAVFVPLYIPLLSPCVVNHAPTCWNPRNSKRSGHGFAELQNAMERRWDMSIIQIPGDVEFVAPNGWIRSPILMKNVSAWLVTWSSRAKKKMYTFCHICIWKMLQQNLLQNLYTSEIADVKKEWSVGWFESLAWTLLSQHI